jgi:hypothetical protein
MKKKIIYFVLIVLIISLLVPVMMSFPRFWNYAGSPDSWVGFWGSLLGSLLGVIGAYLVMSIQLQSDKESTRLKEAKDERPYFFINALSKNIINFEFYNANHSLLNYVEVRTFYNNSCTQAKHSFGHIKANTTTGTEFHGRENKPDIIVINAQTLLGENILYIYGSRNGVGITNTFIYNKKKVIEVYTGPDDYHQFNDIIAKVIGGNVEKNKQ